MDLLSYYQQHIQPERRAGKRPARPAARRRWQPDDEGETMILDHIVAAGWQSGGGNVGTAYVCDDPAHYLMPAMDWYRVSDALAERVEEAAAAWVGCDWQTDYEIASEDVAAAAECAAEWGRKAVEHLRAGDFASAAECLQMASAAENDYGDDPIWGVPRRWLESIREQLDQLTPGMDAEIDVDGPTDVTWELRRGVYLIDRAAITSPVAIGNWAWEPTHEPLPQWVRSAACAAAE